MKKTKIDKKKSKGYRLNQIRI